MGKVSAYKQTTDASSLPRSFGTMIRSTSPLRERLSEDWEGWSVGDGRQEKVLIDLVNS